MNCVIYNIILPNDKTLHLSAFSDLHVDSPETDTKKLIALMNRRAKLQNAVFFSVGDMFNAILPGDLRRFSSAENLRSTANRSDMVDAIVDRGAALLSRYPWALIGMGNHEHSVMQHHMTDLCARMASKCALPTFMTRADGDSGIANGQYSGFVRLRFWDGHRRMDNSSGARATLDIAYHHGAWCGKGRGVAPATEWALTMQGARLFLFGHNHAQAAWPFSWCRVPKSSSGYVVQETGWIVNCGTSMSSVSGRPTYSERKGHPIRHVGVPLIKLRIKNERHGKQRISRVVIDVSQGDE